MVDLPDADAARICIRRTFCQGGVFETSWCAAIKTSSTTMWQFDGDPGNLRFLFIGEAKPGTHEQAGTFSMPSAPI